MTELSELASIVGAPIPINPPKDIWLKGANGKQLHGQHWGATGPRVLLLHGGAQSAETWTLVCLLLQADFQCIAMDLRGHGDSEWDEDYTIKAHVLDVTSAIQQLEWSSFHLVGMSLGGVVAAHFTLSQIETSVKSLALIDVAPGVSFTDITRLREFIAADTVTQGIDALIQEAQRLGARQSDTELRFRYTALTRQDAGGTYRWKRDDRKPADYAHILEHIEILKGRTNDFHCPVLLVRGGRSRILTEQAAREFVAKCPAALLAIVDRAGHSVQEDNPIDLAAELQRFWHSG